MPWFRMHSESTVRHLALLGGFRRSGRWAVPEHLVVVAAVGGADVDLAGSVLPPLVTVTKVSLVGGTRLTVPAGVPVEVHGFSVFGRVDDSAAPRDVPAGAPRILVRSYGLAGGLRVVRAADGVDVPGGPAPTTDDRPV
ncbi:hypothetical protein [Nakamurella endophytica]|uniref:Cell wall-active antibiotics response LiaF-like C-terminal domain-containing protein n=1 Tax=Nakamurella endophytica TaxID=1748367 RepID=A0A917SRV5_9ACTN|nr:hypothetical protein [Nakamurella endophytica]GGL93136.1 hypothetical protein GCM10011594_11180 [Nakamurella endophytica]